MPYKDEIRAIVKAARLGLLKKESAEMILLANEWNNSVLKPLEIIINELSELEAPTISQLYDLAKWKEFLQRATRLQAEYADYSNVLISNGQKEFGSTGIEMAQLAVSVYSPNFSYLPFDAINGMIGKSFKDGSPLRDLLIKRYGESADRVARTLVESTAIGRNPIATARLIGNDLTGSLYNTLRITRTEQMEIFRTSSQMQYVESGIVKGIDLIIAPDACQEVCVPAAMKNPYPLNYSFDELHPNCRCAYAPVV